MGKLVLGGLIFFGYVSGGLEPVPNRPVPQELDTNAIYAHHKLNIMPPKHEHKQIVSDRIRMRAARIGPGTVALATQAPVRGSIPNGPLGSAVCHRHPEAPLGPFSDRSRAES